MKSIVLTRVIVSLSLSFITFFSAWALIPPDEQLPYYGQEFYQDLNDGILEGPFLTQILNQILAGAHVQKPNEFDEILPHCPKGWSCRQHLHHTYRQARVYMFGELHLQHDKTQGYWFTSFYCRRKMTRNEFSKGPYPGPDTIPNGSLVNAEHMWPQSKFSSRANKGLQKSDLHTLRPTLAYANVSRLNHPFGEVLVTQHSPCAGVRKGYLGKGQKQLYFEPPDEVKGDVARALFYFSVRYNAPIPGTEESFLRRWHEQDPVDTWELFRHQGVADFQQIRNPFVDHSELVALIEDF
jgi:deoxyribonuclease-1